MKNISSYLYIFFGIFLVLFFGGSLLIQILGMLAGFLMIHHGFMMLAGRSMFRSFTFFSQDRYR